MNPFGGTCKSSGAVCANASWPLQSCVSANALKVVRDRCIGKIGCGQPYGPKDDWPGPGNHPDAMYLQMWGLEHEPAAFWVDGPPGQFCYYQAHRMTIRATCSHHYCVSPPPAPVAPPLPPTPPSPPLPPTPPCAMAPICSTVPEGGNGNLTCPPGCAACRGFSPKP